MSKHATGFLRSSRRAEEIHLGADGRAVEPPSGLTAEDAPETAEAADIVDRAREHATDVVAKAMRESSAIQDEAYSEGRDQGYRDGASEARAELADALALVQRAGQEARAVHDRLMWSAEREMVELVIAAVGTVLGERVATEPTLVIDTVERALTRAGAQNVVRVRVHPEDHQLVLVAMAERHGDAVPFQVIDDHTIAVGGCIVDTQAGEVDARLDVQLAEVARVLRAAVPDTARLMGAHHAA